MMKKKLSVFKVWLLALLVAGLAACGGGGDDNNGNNNNNDNTTPPVAIASLNFSPASAKTFRFSWDDVADATHYKLMENPDGASGFTQVGADVAQGTQTVDHVVPLYARVNARYLLQSCNSGGCTDSGVESIADFISQGGSIGQVAADITASNAEGVDEFGYSISISTDGSTLAVGAVAEDSNHNGSNSDQANNDEMLAGAVYVFMRNGSDWQQQAYLKSTRANAYLFGISVSLSADGNTLAAGADTGDGLGRVDVFTRSGTTWAHQQELSAAQVNDDDFFGRYVSLSADGNTLAVGAPDEDSDGTNPANNDAENSGAAYIFARSGTSWTQQAYLKADIPGDGDQFGHVSLAADGNTLAVGAFLYDHIGNNNTNIDNIGSVYIFTRNGTQWPQQARLEVAQAQSLFGYAVSLSANGDVLAAGAPGEANGNGTRGDAGATYLFARNSGVWVQMNRLVSTIRDDGDRFGESVSLSPDGGTLAIGAPGEDSNATDINRGQDNNGELESGAVFVYSQTAGNWTEIAYIKPSDSEAEDTFGFSVSLADDGALAAGSYTKDFRTGKAYVY